MAVAFEKGVEVPSQPAQEASPDLLDFDGLGVSEGAPAAGGQQVGTAFVVIRLLWWT